MKRLLGVSCLALVVTTLWTVRPLTAQTGGVWIEPRVSGLVPTRDLGRTDVLESSGFATFERADPSLSVGVGLGVRRSSLSWQQPDADFPLPALGFDETGLAYRLGLGVERSFEPATLFGEVEGAISRFGGGPYRSVEGRLAADRQTAMDVGLVGGIRIGLR